MNKDLDHSRNPLQVKLTIWRMVLLSQLESRNRDKKYTCASGEINCFMTVASNIHKPFGMELWDVLWSGFGWDGR